MPDAGRVITGSAGGLRLKAPGSGTRPLGDKVKQALFSMLEAERADIWTAPLLDLFAGSGAAGIEALSRGAPAVVLVERDGRAARTIVDNLAHTRLAERARIVRADAVAWLEAPAVAPEAPFGSVVLDPPYERPDDLAGCLDRLGRAEAAWLDPAAVLVAKHFWRDDPPLLAGHLRRTRQRRFGETMLSVYRRVPDTAAGGS